MQCNFSDDITVLINAKGGMRISRHLGMLYIM